MAFSGFLMSDLSGRTISFFNIFEIPALFPKHDDFAKNFHLVHEYVGIPLAILIGLHFLGTLYHRFILKDDVLARMLPGVCSKKKVFN
jgi:cytochrome b561